MWTLVRLPVSESSEISLLYLYENSMLCLKNHSAKHILHSRARTHIQTQPCQRAFVFDFIFASFALYYNRNPWQIRNFVFTHIVRMQTFFLSVAVCYCCFNFLLNWINQLENDGRAKQNILSVLNRRDITIFGVYEFLFSLHNVFTERIVLIRFTRYGIRIMCCSRDKRRRRILCFVRFTLKKKIVSRSVQNYFGMFYCL